MFNAYSIIIPKTFVTFFFRQDTNHAFSHFHPKNMFLFLQYLIAYKEGLGKKKFYIIHLLVVFSYDKNEINQDLTSILFKESINIYFLG